MLSLPISKSILSGRLHIPSFILPLLVLSVTFTSKPVYPDILLHQIFSSSFILFSIILFYRHCKNKFLAFFIPGSVILLRVLREVTGGSLTILEVAYFIPYSVLLLGTGAKMLRDYPMLLLRQIVWICAICVLLSIMQILGVQWAQSIANFYWYSGGTTEKYLFVKWTDIYPSNIQLRPVGFASANNVVSQYLLFFYAFGLSWFVGGKKSVKLPLKWMFVIAFACALTGSKLVLAGAVIVCFAMLFLSRGKELFHFFRVLLTTGFAYLVYWFLFPGVFVYNYNPDLFAFNAMLRIINLIGIQKIPYVDRIFQYLSQFQTGDYIGQRSVFSTIEKYHERGSIMTGLDLIAPHLPLLFIGAAIIIPLWTLKLKTIDNPYTNIKKVAIIMLVAALGSSAGGPFLTTSYFWFFFSFAMYPITVTLLKKWRTGRLMPVHAAGYFSTGRI